jgi:GxxExxY protein
MEKDPHRFEGELLTQSIIGAAIEVHKVLGPGLLESAYQDALCYELTGLSLRFDRQPFISLNYKTMRIERAFRPDIVVEEAAIVELKSIEKILPIHELQLRTYLNLTGIRRGLIFNFNTELLRSGIRRIDR